ncbi:MAG TPA: hypothetical protein VGY55_09660, partial [Pirellulales bacterium]|nr:hypothetical protein [Pirellulales bacterium]
MPRFAKLMALLAAVVAITCGIATAADVTSTYSGASANWTTAAWVNVPAGGGFPNNGGGTTYDAVFNDGFSGDGPLTLDQNITIQKFTLNVGTLTGTFNLTTNDMLHDTGGRMSGTGITNANAGIQIDGYLNVFDTRTINVAGSSSFTGDAGAKSGNLYWNNAATLNNSGTFDAGWSLNFNNNIGANLGSSDSFGTFNNSGTFTRSVGTGTTTVNIPFNNSHIVTVQAGTLLLNGGGMETGSFQAASGATLNFGGSGTTLAAGSSLSGPGTTIISGTVSVTGPAVTYSGGGTLQVTGILNGAGTLTATAPVELFAGTMAGGGITNTNGGLSIDGYPDSLDTRTLNNGGSASFTGVAIDQFGYFYLYNGAILNNSGTFDSGWSLNFNNNIVPNGTTGTFNNTGTFTRSVGTGTTTVSVPFNNSHIVTVQAGTLLLNGGGTETGSFQAASGATLNFGGSGTTLAAGSSLSGPGTTIISGTVSVT